MYKIFAICLMLTLTSYAQAQEPKNKIRAFVATKLAQSILTKNDKPNDIEQDLCNGSGYIVHGDGHRTVCPGCNACRKKDENVQQVVVENLEPEYYMYHLGARWCGPCQKMKQTTWQDEDLKTFMQNKRIKLVILDEEDGENKKFFSYYQVKLYPTIIMLKANELEKVLAKRTGFINPEGVKGMIEESKLNE